MVFGERGAERREYRAGVLCVRARTRKGERFDGAAARGAGVAYSHRARERVRRKRGG